MPFSFSVTLCTCIWTLSLTSICFVFCYHFQRKETVQTSSTVNPVTRIPDIVPALRSYDTSYSAANNVETASYYNTNNYNPNPSMTDSVPKYNNGLDPVYASAYAIETINSADLFHIITTTLGPEACRSTTYRTILGCYCRLIGKRCYAANSICKADQLGDGYCECDTGYVKLGLQCVTQAAYNNITMTAAQASSSFTIYPPTVIASCFLPLNSVFGNVGSIAGNGSLTYTLTLLSSSPLGDSTKHVDIDPANGNLIYKSVAPGSVINQIYSLSAKDSRGNTTSKNFTVAYNCTAPTCSFNFGNSLIVDCLRFTTGDTIVTFIANNSLTPTVFSMSLINSSSRNGNNFFQIGSNTGLVFLQKIPHGGAFVENYSVSATNAAGQSCPAQTLTLTTTDTCI
ncbi:uncharacterized protein LOC129591357 [Paramacrobiotus metropolitanus]|uniref:uncharacterized protein LOC129591357 n=1 Tax=Paramacrobiotus metropolitanus TaxID=2943436 RepID=UPI002445FEB2|nr:uncharacterized protein LOC129591357 [Paramacrobiotus metropolitanus]